MEVRSAAESVYRELELRRGVAKVTANGAISAVLVRDFGQGGGDPGEKCFTLTRKDIGGTIEASCWGQKGDSG